MRNGGLIFNWKTSSFVVLVMVSTFLMVRIILPYTSWEWNVDFLKTKQFIIHLDYYRLAFYVHIFSSAIILAGGMFLFPKYILTRYPEIHKKIGKLYVSLVLFLSAPGGFIMAFHANGGIWVKLSFLILTPLWWYVTYKGFQTIRKGKIQEHKRWMIRSYALTLSAISLRFYQLLLSQLVYLDPPFQYLLVSWLSWTGNLIFAELYIQKMKLRNKGFQYMDSNGLHSTSLNPN